MLTLCLLYCENLQSYTKHLFFSQCLPQSCFGSLIFNFNHFSLISFPCVFSLLPESLRLFHFSSSPALQYHLSLQTYWPDCPHPIHPCVHYLKSLHCIHVFLTWVFCLLFSYSIWACMEISRTFKNYQIRDLSCIYLLSCLLVPPCLPTCKPLGPSIVSTFTPPRTTVATLELPAESNVLLFVYACSYLNKYYKLCLLFAACEDILQQQDSSGQCWGTLYIGFL